MAFDETGKHSFDDIYTAPDPRPFFDTLRGVEYQIPQLAKPYFAKVIEGFRAEHGRAPTVLDVGCSYGVNAALYRGDCSMDELYDHYESTDSLSRDELIARDRRFVPALPDAPRFIGLDASEPALDYALEAGFLDDVLHANLEDDEPTDEQRAQLAGTDVVVSTGCLGYVTDKTITRVANESRPWMAHFVLRMFSYEPIAASLAELGYETASIHGVFRQRRFTSAEEQAQILDTLAVAGVDPDGLESEGWLYAQLYVSRPRDAAPLASALNSVSHPDQG